MQKNVYREQRILSIDLLRILAILFVVAGHFIIHDSGIRKAYEAGQLDGGEMLLSVVYSVCVIAVNVFFLISGYFRIRFHFRKIIVLTVYMYMVSFTTSFIMKYLHWEYSIKYAVFPFSSYWFVSVYILLILFSPLINHAIDSMCKRDFLIFASTYLFVWGIQDMLFNTGYIAVNDGYSVFHAMAIIFVGGGIRKFYNEIKPIYGAALFISVILAETVISILLNKMRHAEKIPLMFAYDSVFTLLAAAGLFLVFAGISITEGKRIGRQIHWLAEGSLTVYLLDSSELFSDIRKYASDSYLLIFLYLAGIMTAGVLLQCLCYKKRI